MKKLFVTFLSLVLLAACNAPSKKESFAGKVEKAHQKEVFLSHSAVQFDFYLTFGGKERLNGQFTLSTDSGKGLIELSNGQKIYYINNEVYASSEMENLKRIRFDAYTWSYFFLFPYKLNDGGTVWNDYPDKALNGKNYAVEKLSFTSGTGDSPDDWYVVYADEETDLVYASAYIVTMGKSKEKAEEDPHAIVYKDYKEVEGIPIASKWEFRGWNEKEGLTDLLGEATLKQVKFVELPNDFFIPEESFQKVEL